MSVDRTQFFGVYLSVGGGLAYGSHGYTHHGVEDFAVTCALPNITVAAPGDPAEAREVARLAAVTPGPAYIRLGKAGEPLLHHGGISLEVGRSVRLKSGKDLTLFTTGGILDNALKVAALLEQKGYSAGVISAPYLVPFDEAAVLEAARETPAILTIEEHGWGGLGTIVADVLARNRCGVYFHPLRLKAKPVKVSGSQEYLRQQHGIGMDDIFKAAIKIADEARGALVSTQAKVRYDENRSLV